MTIETSTSIGNLASALGKFQAETHGVVRDATNPFHKNRYATLEAVIETARPALTKSGLAFLQAPMGLDITGRLQLETMLMHGASGEWIRFTTTMPLVKSDPQGVGSAITYACRYALMAMLGLPPLDDDAEATKPQQRTQPKLSPEDNQVMQGGRPPQQSLQALAQPGIAEKISPSPHNPNTGEIIPPTEDSRSVYVKKSIELIEQIQTPDAVSAWLDREVEKGVWKQYGISEHHDDGKAILMACKKRRLELWNTV